MSALKLKKQNGPPKRKRTEIIIKFELISLIQWLVSKKVLTLIVSRTS